MHEGRCLFSAARRGQAERRSGSRPGRTRKQKTLVPVVRDAEPRAAPASRPTQRRCTAMLCFVTVSTCDPIVNLASKNERNMQSRLLAHHHNQGWMLHRHNSLRELLTWQQPEKLHGTTASQDQRSSNPAKKKSREIFFEHLQGTS
jgi:hypothetical protein